MATLELDIATATKIFRAMPKLVDAAERRAAERAAMMIETEAKRRMGTYQGDEGPFKAWPELADNTQKERREQGYTPNDPLLREGLLRAAITHDVEAKGGEVTAIVGVKHGMVAHPYTKEMVDIGQVAIDQELGTARIPPRSFIGAAGFHEAPTVRVLVGQMIADTLSGKPPRNR